MKREKTMIEIKPEDIRVDSFSVRNKGMIFGTSNGIRITHLPSGIIIEESEDRSQHRNRHNAMEKLVNILEAIEYGKSAKEKAAPAPTLNLDEAGYWDSPTQCMAASRISELEAQIEKMDRTLLACIITTLNRFGLTGKDADDFVKGEYNGRG